MSPAVVRLFHPVDCRPDDCMATLSPLVCRDCCTCLFEMPLKFYDDDDDAADKRTSIMEMFIHHEGRYMKYSARETDMKQRYRQKASVHVSYRNRRVWQPGWRLSSVRKVHRWRRKLQLRVLRKLCWRRIPPLHRYEAHALTAVIVSIIINDHEKKNHFYCAHYKNARALQLFTVEAKAKPHNIKLIEKNIYKM